MHAWLTAGPRLPSCAWSPRWCLLPLTKPSQEARCKLPPFFWCDKCCQLAQTIGISPLWIIIFRSGRCPWEQRLPQAWRGSALTGTSLLSGCNPLRSQSAHESYFHLAVRWYQCWVLAMTSSAWMNLPNALLGHKVQDIIKHSGNDSCASLQSVRTNEEIAWRGMHLNSNLAPCTLSALQDLLPPPEYFTSLPSPSAGKLGLQLQG